MCFREGPSSCSCPYFSPLYLLLFPPSPPSALPTIPRPTLPSLPNLPLLPTFLPPTFSAPHIYLSLTASPPYPLASPHLPPPSFSSHHHYSSPPYFPASEHFGPGTEDFHNLLAMHYGQVQVISARAVLYDLLKRCGGEVGGQCVWGEGIRGGQCSDAAAALSHGAYI